jgi:hypothetical protein
MMALTKRVRRLLNFAGIRPEGKDGTQGQILGDTPMGAWLKALVFDPEVRHVVEIGTWKGLGSTILLHAAAWQRTERPEVLSLEANAEFYQIARENVPDDGVVNILLGSIVEQADLDTADLSPQEKFWLQSDLAAISSVPNVLDELPREISLLLLDGGEFSSYAEFAKLEERLTKWLVLDDIFLRKNRRVHAELASKQQWNLVTVGKDRHGWAVWLKA